MLNELQNLYRTPFVLLFSFRPLGGAAQCKEKITKKKNKKQKSTETHGNGQNSYKSCEHYCELLYPTCHNVFIYLVVSVFLKENFFVKLDRFRH